MCWRNTNKTVVTCFGGGESRPVPGEKTQQAGLNHEDLTKHKCRNIGLTDWMGVPCRQAGQKGVHRNCLLDTLYHCQSVFGIFTKFPQPHFFQKCKEYLSPAFSEGPDTTILQSMQRKLSLNLCKFPPSPSTCSPLQEN